MSFADQNCVPLYPPHNGDIVIKTELPGPGRIIMYRCNDGFNIDGNHGYNERTCLIDGEWTGSMVVCKSTEVAGIIVITQKY